MDAVSEQRLSLVIPILKEKVEAMSLLLQGQGIVIRVVQGLRTWDEQAALYAQGRGLPGSIVTDAPAGYSMHNFGLAVDCVPSLQGVDAPYNPDWTAGDWRYGVMVEAGESQGLVSGSTWTTLVDWPHFQLGGLPVTPTQQMRDDYEVGGLELVWSKTISGGYA